MMTLPDRTWVVVPCFNAHESVQRLISQLPAEIRARCLVIDDGSEPAIELDGVTVLRHPQNRGYGAAQKTGYAAAIKQNAERVVLLHGDAQYPTAETLALADLLDHCDVAIGSRFLIDRGRTIPWWRRWGNRALTRSAQVRFGTAISELHSGARAYRVDALRQLDFLSFSDNYVFDQQVLVGLLARGARFDEAPITARYDDTVQSISLRDSVRYGIGCLRVILQAK